MSECLCEEKKKKKMEVVNRYVAIKYHLNGAPKESDFELKSGILALSVDAESNYVLVKNIYLSIDPAQIHRMKKSSTSQKEVVLTVSHCITPGMVISAYGLGRVVDSGHPGFEKGDVVLGFLGWEDYSLLQGALLRKLDAKELEFPVSYHVGILGLSGLTAYAGFFNVCKPKKGETVFVSAASGSVGNLVGQFAKLFGCYVVGCAGTRQKVDVLTDKLGFDAAFNYKEQSDLSSTLKRYFPDGIDIYFDNVGGEMLEAAIENMNLFGRVALCGVISEYTDTRKQTGPNMTAVVYKRITIQGFLALDYMHVFADFISTTSDGIREGKLCVLEDISHGIENIPSAFVGLFLGGNIGKKMVQVADI